MPPRCIKCLTTLMPDADVCPRCGGPAPPKSALTQQRSIDKTQFIQIAPGEVPPGYEKPAQAVAPPVPPPAISRRSLILAVVLGLLAGAFMLLVMANLSHTRH